MDGENAVLEGVEAGCGFSSSCARSGRFLGVGAAGFALFGSGVRHEAILDLRLAGGFEAGGGGRA
jgi:hypothetical protein